MYHAEFRSIHHLVVRAKLLTWLSGPLLNQKKKSNLDTNLIALQSDLLFHVHVQPSAYRVLAHSFHQ